MRIKMIATDLDNTLLHTDKTISKYTAEVFNICRRRGIKIVFATARPKRTVESFFDSIPADAVIFHNGAVIYANGTQIFHCGINPKITQNILLSLNRDFPEATLSAEIDDVLYANFNVLTIWSNTEAILTDFSNLPDKPAEKIIVGVSSMNDIERFSKYLPSDLYIEMSDNRIGLIMRREATKFRAVQFLSGHYGLTVNEIAAFGDDYNDLGMIRGCGVGVAMENALDEVKAVADYICTSNDDDGVAKWVAENLL